MEEVSYSPSSSLAIRTSTIVEFATFTTIVVIVVEGEVMTIVHVVASW